MKQIGKSNSRHAQVYVNQFYDVVAQNDVLSRAALNPDTAME